MVSDLLSRLEQVREKMYEAARAAGRSEAETRLVAASKSQNPENISALSKLGVADFGENYVQEALEKQKQLADLNLTWHFIGQLQSNKAKQVVGEFALLHTLDRVSLAQALEKEAKKKETSIRCLIEINIDKESKKGGVFPEDVFTLAEQLQSFSRLHVIGLMCIPSPLKTPSESRVSFAKMRGIKEALNNRKIFSQNLTELSMGMSNDYYEAIQEGATMVRVGSAIFGERLAD